MPSHGFIALCSIDGTEASADALMPWIVRTSRGELPEVLDALKFAMSLAPPRSPVAALVAESGTTHAKRTSHSPIADLFAKNGWGAVTPITIAVDSTTFVQGLLREASLYVHLDAATANAITIAISRHVRAADGSLPTLRTNLDALVLEPDQLGLGPLASLEDLPDYVAHAAQRMQMAWFWDEANIRTKLRGKKREAVRAWISSGKSAAK